MVSLQPTLLRIHDLGCHVVAVQVYESLEDAEAVAKLERANRQVRGDYGRGPTVKIMGSTKNSEAWKACCS